MSQRSSRGQRHSRHRQIEESDEEIPAPAYTAQARRRSKAAARAGPSHREDTFELDTPSQASQKGNPKLPQEEENHLIASVIRYLFIADRPKTMIQRAHIVKNVLPNHSKYFKHIISKVGETLKEIFGYNLVELEGNKFILTNKIENNEPHLSFSRTERKEMVLCFITLAHIFMCGENGCHEDELFKLYRSLEIIEEEDYINPYFGNLKTLVTDKFVKQGYLELVVVDRSDPPIKHYQWGPRAENELSPRKILEFMSKIFGGRPLNTWPEQFKIMQTRENGNMNGKGEDSE